MVLKCETYPGVGYQQQSYMMVRESDGYSQNGHYGSSGMPMEHAYSHKTYPQSHMPVFQQGHTEQKHHSGWDDDEQEDHSGWGHDELKHHSGYETSPEYDNAAYYNFGLRTMYSGGVPLSEEHQGSKYGDIGAGHMTEKVREDYIGWGNGHSNYSHGIVVMGAPRSLGHPRRNPLMNGHHKSEGTNKEVYAKY